MARGITVTGTTANVTASGGTLGVHITGVPNTLNITKVKITPSAGSGASTVEIFQKDTLGGADLMEKWKAVSGNVYDPMDNSSGTPAEGNPSQFTCVYEDADATGEIHLKFTNNDTVDKTYDYAITYEETWRFDASNVATAQKAELLQGYLYFVGRTVGDGLLKLSSGQFEVRLGNDSDYANFLAASVFTKTGALFFVGNTTSDVLLTKVGTSLQVRLGDNSAYAGLFAADLLSSTGIVFLAGGAATDVSLRRSATTLQIRLGNDSGYATIDAGAYKVGGTAGVDFNGAITNLTISKGIVTAAS